MLRTLRLRLRCLGPAPMGSERWEVSAKTSIGFGGGEIIEVALPLDEVRQVVQRGIRNHVLVELVAQGGEQMVFNPAQVKVLQALDGEA